jgi:hypothetical protein
LLQKFFLGKKLSSLGVLFRSFAPLISFLGQLFGQLLQIPAFLAPGICGCSFLERGDTLLTELDDHLVSGRLLLERFQGRLQVLD